MSAKYTNKAYNLSPPDIYVHDYRYPLTLKPFDQVTAAIGVVCFALEVTRIGGQTSVHDVSALRKMD